MLPTQERGKQILRWREGGVSRRNDKTKNEESHPYIRLRTLVAELMVKAVRLGAKMGPWESQETRAARSEEPWKGREAAEAQRNSWEQSGTPAASSGAWPVWAGVLEGRSRYSFLRSPLYFLRA